MKRILVTAQNSYIGNSFADWVKDDDIKIEFLSCRSDEWKKKSFSEYDVVYHVAGIAHLNEKKVNSELYYTVNRDLTIDLATKSKDEGVLQFIFLSSMSVYGLETGIINKNTIENPVSNYGKSKLQAENELIKLESDNFSVVILRPPMVYGRGCKGNYTKLSKISKKLPIFPDSINKRSMIYIDNLSELVKIIINNKSKGIFYPQNEEYVNTASMVRLISKYKSSKIYIFKVPSEIIKYLKIGSIKKIFGTLVYDMSLSEHHLSYCCVNFNDSIELTESGAEI
ncbi:NAD-dependent epimerase/dehydratase family protein [Paenibacillus paeoniae]|uniref:NAD-dependent epimerase/dehydratase family protein n=1 Tax=Paenibacillus paeoniae TaxID=2292705 RepID=A0A371P019_9BACL|nr:NAD-dependent epimerase/dehydratase family protein [Paenibacillus paeoniae]REK69274.1 NAD-dependent epimerase/dehydratase family protein [Paenibacillus paeoniae]